MVKAKEVTVVCRGCGEPFLCTKTWTVTRRFCAKCASQRNASSKQNFERQKKNGVSRSPEDVEASRLLRHIPDSVNWHAILQKV